MDATQSPSEDTLSADDQLLVDGVLAGQRRALAKTITLIESTRIDHQQRAQKVLAELLPHTGRAIRLGISGVPGAGKSTFIEALGIWLIDQGHRLAVLAVDPSSSVSGGSILGDKTRMELLCQREQAFIRPSPSAGSLGGVAEKTREAMLACEASGYDVILVETVGVGQSETTVAGMVEFWAEIERFRSAMTQSGELEEKRKKQALNWMWSLIESGLHYHFRSHPAVHAALPELTRQVAEGSATPGTAAKRLLAYLKD